MPPAHEVPGTTRRRLGRTLSGPRWSEYRRLLQHALARGYRVVSLEDWLREPAGGHRDERVLVLRHDVDQHPRAARRMLAIERQLGIASTWYFRWRTADRRIIDAVRHQGGAVGLHYETLTRRVLRTPAATVDDRLVEDCRGELRREIATFKQLFGPIRSICPHGDSRIPTVSNQVLLRGLDASSVGVEMDGNHGLRGHRLAAWLTDRSTPDGSWSEGQDPIALLDDGASPLFCLTHPNNFASGPGLWLDRILAGILPRPAAGGGRLIPRTGSDEPPRQSAAPVPEPSAFAPIADRLRDAVAEHFSHRGTPLEGPAGLNTLVTNSSYAERRTDTLLDVLFRHSELTELDGLRVLDAGCGLGAMALVLASRGASVLGIDPNAERFAVGASVAQEFGLPVTFRQGSMQHAALGEETFDLVVANNSFCYLVDRGARRAALAALRAALRPGGWIAMRNPNRLFPLDQFTGLPFVGLLEPDTANRLMRRIGRRRSEVRLLAPSEASAELRAAGFQDVVVTGARTDPLHQRLDALSRYQHAIGRRPPQREQAAAALSLAVEGQSRA